MLADILSNLVITKVVSTNTMYNETGAQNKRINRNCWSIIIKYEGQTVYTCGDETVISDAQNLVILPKGCSYVWRCTKSGHFTVVEFDSPMTLPNIIGIPIRNSERILKRMKELEYKRLVKKNFYKAESIRDTYNILLLLAQSASKKYLPAEKYDKISIAINYIAKNYNKEIKNDDLAKLTGLSTVYFRKLFSDVLGTSPINYVHTLRIKKAKEMLESDYSSITDIAVALGYPNIYDFSRTFKKHTGISPSKY